MATLVNPGILRYGYPKVCIFIVFLHKIKVFRPNSDFDETWSAGRCGPKSSVEHHILAIKTHIVVLGGPRGAKMLILKFLGLVPECPPLYDIACLSSRV